MFLPILVRTKTQASYSLLKKKGQLDQRRILLSGFEIEGIILNLTYC